MKLSLQNIRTNKLRSILAIIAVSIAGFSLLSFLAIKDGFSTSGNQQLQSKNPLNQITITANPSKQTLLSFIAPEEGSSLNADSLAKFSQIKGIEKIYPEIQFNNFASLEVNIFGLDLLTDTLIFGVDKDFISEDLANEDWQSNTEPYPVIIPRKILDLYNLTIAGTQGLPALQEKNLLGKEITLYPNQSTFFPGGNNGNGTSKLLKIAGFSDKINLIGITLPYKLVEKFNLDYTGKVQTKFTKFYVITKDPMQSAQIAQQIEALGYRTEYLQKNLKAVEAKIKQIAIVLFLINFIILLTAAIAIIASFLAGAEERKKEIGLLRALGAQKSQIRKIILTEATIIGFIGSISGIALAIIGAYFINKFNFRELVASTFAPEKIMNITWSGLLITFLFTIFFAMLSAYIPANIAANTKPIEAIRK